MNNMDIDYYLSKNKYWSQLDAEWGQPVDLDTSTDDLLGTARQRALCRRSTLNLPTFASHDFIQNVKMSTDKRLHSLTDYDRFKEDVTDKDSSMGGDSELNDPKPFYFINGNIMSYQSVEQICHEIDAVFRPLVTNEAKTSTLKNESKRTNVSRRTIRKKRVPQFPSIIENSLSISNLSFDESSFNSSKFELVNGNEDSAFSQLRTPPSRPTTPLDESNCSHPGVVHEVEDALSNLSKALTSKQTEQRVNEYIDCVFSVVEDVSRIITSANDDLDISNIAKESPCRNYNLSKKRNRAPENGSDCKICQNSAKVVSTPKRPQYAKQNEIVKSPNFRAVRDFWARMT